MMTRSGFLLAMSLLSGGVAGCSSLQSPNGGSATLPEGVNAVAPAPARQMPLSMAHYVPPSIHPDRRPSHMQADAGKRSGLLYVGDWATNDVYVYNNANGESEGTLTGFSEPYGQCVDAKGDIYIANFGDGTVVEYAHGGTSPINTYSSGGEPIGCAVDAKGDVAVTSFSPAEVVVYAGGDPSKGKAYTGACDYLWTMGSDDKGDLVGIGEESTGSIVACGLLAGSKSMIVLSGCCGGSMSIGFPGGTTWDGKYFAITDQEAGGQFESAIFQVTLSGTTLIKEGETLLTDTCYSDYVDLVNPFIYGKKNIPASHKQGTVLVDPNLWCNDAGTAVVDYWHYPAGGGPFKRLHNPPSEPYGTGVSLKT